MSWSSIERLQNAASLAFENGSFDSILETMSIRSLSKLAFGGAQVLLGAGTLGHAASASCPNPGELSCRNTTAVADLCCFNAPGGQLVLTQFWDTAPATGPSNSWTVHGLWYDTMYHYSISTVLTVLGLTIAMALTMQAVIPDAPIPTSLKSYSRSAGQILCRT